MSGANKPGDEGFFSRWSRRKSDVASTAPDADAAVANEATKQNPPSGADFQPKVSETPRQTDTLPKESAPLPSVESLSAESDYSPFMAREVDPATRNAAMKKLFTDPHYNVMDGLDIYIDDYGKPDPLPESWIQKMTQSIALGLVKPEETPAEAQAATTAVDTPDSDAVQAIEADAVAPLPPVPDMATDIAVPPPTTTANSADPE